MALLRSATVHRPRQVDHQVGDGRRRQDRLVAPRGQLNGALRPPESGRQLVEHGIGWHIDEVGCARSRPRAGTVALGVDLHRARRLRIPPAQSTRGGDERRRQDVARVPVQAVGAREGARQRFGNAAEDLDAGAGNRCIPIAYITRCGKRRCAVAGFRRRERSVLRRRHQCGDGRRIDLGGCQRPHVSAIASPDHRDHRDSALHRNTVGGHRIVRPPQRGVAGVGDRHDRLVGLAQPRRLRQRDVDDLLCGDHRHRPPSVRVLSTLTPRNNAAGQPWLTGATCPGCALPQLNAPPSRHVDAPPTASIAPQKSVVVAW